MDALSRDLSHALRGFVRRPGFALLAVVAFALGVGVNTAVFSVVYSLLLRPLPVAGADRLVSLSEIEGDTFPGSMSFPDYRDYSDLDAVFSGAIAYAPLQASFNTEGREPARIIATMVTGNYFEFLEVEAALGRTFTTEEAERQGAGNVVVLSHAFWQNNFAGDPGVIGAPVQVNRSLFTVIGVAPKHFPGTIAILGMDAYVPLTAGNQLTPGLEETLEDRGSGGFRVIARLQPGVSLAEARAAVEVQAARLAQEYPQTNRGVRGLVYPEPMARVEPAAVQYLPPLAAVFMTMAGLVLLLASANVANLLLARAVGRRKEMAIRVAMGASRLRIVRQLLTESTLLALLGGLAGVLFARWAAGMMSSLRFATDLPLVFDFRLDYRVLAFALLAAALAGVVSGLAPAFQVRLASVSDTLKDAGRRGAGGEARGRLRGVLVVAQVSVSLVLLVCAGLFVRSMWNAARIDLGFEVENHLVLAMDADLGGFDEGEGRVFYRELVDRVRGLGGVRAASLARFLPVGYSNATRRIFVEGQVASEDEGRVVFFNTVGTDYFATVGTPILRGRGFTDDDVESARGVVVVNERMAEVLWPGEDPIGKRLRVEGADGPLVEVIGVAKLATYLLPGESPLSYFYLPFAQRYSPDRVLHVRTTGDPGVLLPAIREQIRALAPELPIFDVRTMEAHIRQGKGAVLFQLGSGLVGGFGLIGLILAAIGLYSMLAWAVGQRTYEFGVRMALGATSSRILGEVLRRGLVLAAVGIALGLAGALAFTRLFGNVLVDVSATDPVVFSVIPLFLALVAVIASVVPALRATRVDPVVALRAE